MKIMEFEIAKFKENERVSFELFNRLKQHLIESDSGFDLSMRENEFDRNATRIYAHDTRYFKEHPDIVMRRFYDAFVRAVFDTAIY